MPTPAHALARNEDSPCQTVLRTCDKLDKGVEVLYSDCQVHFLPRDAVCTLEVRAYKKMAFRQFLIDKAYRAANIRLLRASSTCSSILHSYLLTVLCLLLYLQVGATLGRLADVVCQVGQASGKKEGKQADARICLGVLVRRCVQVWNVNLRQKKKK